MKKIRWIIAFSLSAWPVMAAEMPRFDVEAHCKKIASFGGNYSAVLDKTCFDQEQQAYDRLKPVWPQLPDAVAAHCQKIAAFGGPGSYGLLEVCVSQETQAMSDKTGKAFKY